jgi:ubiquinone/menaquinone biosynthesis C-methylase UbiE
VSNSLTSSPCCKRSGSPDIRIAVRSAYAELISKKSCCGSNNDLYFGCGDPVINLGVGRGKPHKILDLGCGSGYDLTRLAQKLDSDSVVVGVDMTHEMIVNAQKRVKEVGLRNVDLILADIASLPLHYSSVDAAISNCVINLTRSKSRVFKEVHRVLKEGGMLVVSDIVSDKRIPSEYKKNVKLWSKCLSGAITLKSYLKALNSNGFSTRILNKGLWKKIRGYKFYTVTLTARKNG